MKTNATINKNWNKVVFNDVCLFRKGVSYKSSDLVAEGKGLPFVNLKCISKGGGFNKKGIKYFRGEFRKEHELVPGDLVIANTDLTREGDIVGAPLVIPNLGYKKLIFSMDISKLEPNNDVCNKLFLYYRLQADDFRNHMKRCASGSTVLHLSILQAKQFEFDIPSLPEQQAIARVLTTVQEAISAQEALIAKLKELKRSMMHHLFTHGTRGEKTKMTEIGEIPESWEVVRLAQYSKNQIYIQNGFPCGNWNDKRVGILQIRPFNITDDGKITLNSQKHIETDKNINGYLLKKKDIIFNNTNSEELVGKTALWSEDVRAVVSNHMTIIRLLADDIFDQTYLAHYLHHLWQVGEFLKLCRRHVNQASVSIERLTSVPIPYPQKSEQIKIGKLFESIDKRTEAVEDKLSVYRTLFKSLLHELMSGERRIKFYEKEIK